MGARARAHNVELVLNSEQFNHRVGLISNFHELQWLDLNGHDFSGVFTSCYLPSLIALCASYPDHHILTLDSNGRVINRLVEGEDFYMIGNGDKDPALVLNVQIDPLWLIVYEDGISSALAELNHLKDRRNR